MSNGYVTTARGELLNLDALIMQAKQPLNREPDAASTRSKPHKAVAVPHREVRGNIPTMPEGMAASVAGPVDEAEEDVNTLSPSEISPKGAKAKTVAEMTAVKMDGKEAAKKRGAKKAPKIEIDQEDENVTLGDLVDEMKD